MNNNMMKWKDVNKKNLFENIMRKQKKIKI